MQKNQIRIGTRGSRLALIQAEMVRNALKEHHPGLEAELVIIKTRGDAEQNAPLFKIGDKGLFIKEIEDALIKEEIDMAVHSLKDLPADLPAELCLAAVLEREDPRDVLISREQRALDMLAPGSVVGTSSLRRRAQLQRRFPGFVFTDMRGNVDTRLKKLQAGDCDALILAAAGVIRTGFKGEITEYLPPDIMLPAVCQGIIGIEIRKGDKAAEEWADSINHRRTYTVALAERVFLRRLEGGCRVPIGCYTEIRGNEFRFSAFLANPDGDRYLAAVDSGPLSVACELTLGVADELLAKGGHEIREAIKQRGV